MVQVSPAYNKPAITETLYMRSFVVSVSFERHTPLSRSLKVCLAMPIRLRISEELRQEVVNQGAKIDKAIHRLHRLTVNYKRIRLRQEITQ